MKLQLMVMCAAMTAAAGVFNVDGGSFKVNPNRKGVAPDGTMKVIKGAEGKPERQSQTFTAEAFVQCVPTAAFAHIMSQRQGGMSGASWSLSVNPNGQLCSRFDTKKVKNQMFTTHQQINDGQWHHVALSVDGATHKATLYIDYNEVGKGIIAAPLEYDASPFIIGQGLEGVIKEARITTEVLPNEKFVIAPWFVCERFANKKKMVETPAALDDTYTRVQTSVRPAGLKRIGTLIPKRVDEMSTSHWSLGCECLERNLADWDAYKNYLPVLGIKKIRVQGGWFRCEKEKGKYNFDWLDHIVDEAHERGLQVCLETDYCNPIYNPKGGTGPGAILPTGKEELQAWDNWVEAMVKHYTPKGVNDWMMFNEPNLKSQTNTTERIMDNNLRTAHIIKRINPKATVAAFVTAGLRFDMFTNILTIAKANGEDKLFDYAVFHGYTRNPDKYNAAKTNLVAWLRANTPHIRAWQGEAGCASEEVQYAMSGIAWTEFSQAKWNARCMLCDMKCDVDSLLFTISDLSYSKDFISRYGLLKTRADNSIIKVKMAFYAAQNIVSIFNDALTIQPHAAPEFSTNSIGFVAYKVNATGEDAIAIWDANHAPDECRELQTCTMKIHNGKMTDPVWVDLVSGQIYDFAQGSVKQDASGLTIEGVPYYDGPVAIVPRAILNIEAPKVYKRKVAPNTGKGKATKAK